MVDVRRSTYLAVAVAALLVLTSCHRTPPPDTTAAREAGGRAAVALTGVDHADTLALQSAILKVRAAADSFALAGDSVGAEAFDEAFRTSLAEKDPALHRAIFNKQACSM